MTTQEFSNEFDVLYNNLASNAAPGVNEYEKSVLLTKAQSEIVKAYFNPTSNKSRAGFDSDEKRQYDFSVLIRVAKLFDINSIKERVSLEEKIDKRSKVYLFPSDYFLSVNELLSDNNQFYSVQPITYVEYQRMMTKPYPYPPRRVAWRLITDKKNCNYIQEYIDRSATDFKLVSSWADQKRELHINFKLEANISTPITEDSIIYNNRMLTIPYPDLKGYVTVIMDSGWGDSGTYYDVTFTVKTNASAEKVDLETYVDILKKAFDTYFKTSGTVFPIEEPDGDIEKAYTHTDGLINCEAPKKVLVSELKYPLVGKVINLPLAEVIGKFGSNLQYQMRYVKKPKPIILADISDMGVTIDGIDKITECELAEELHSEILQRAVELAKSAYSGDLNTTLAIGNASATNIGIIPSNNKG